jgi:DNA mismatch repair protein MutS
MLKQYMGFKAEYPDAILFFRLGDFYEMFFDDAKTASHILGITLTSRGVFNGEKVPMCGVPYHSSKNYIARLVESGMKVAVCEQVEEPSVSRGIVKREVVRIVTPGSILDEGNIDEDSCLFIAATYEENGRYGLSYADISTGEMRITQTSERRELLDELGRIKPAELLLPEKNSFPSPADLSVYRLEELDGDWFLFETAQNILREHFGVVSLAGFGCEDMPEAVSAGGALLRYIKETQKGLPGHITEMITYRISDFMVLDETTCSNLELLSTIRRQSVKGSLFNILHHTLTPMGGRLLKKWILYPLVEVEAIKERLDAVSSLREDLLLLDAIREALDGMGDIERLNGRIAMKRANARDLLALRASLQRVAVVKKKLKDCASSLMCNLAANIDTLDDVLNIISQSIRDDPPVSLKDGGIIKEGFDPELDRLIYLSRDGKSWIADFAATEQARTGIPRLKVGFNRIYGYYIEVSKANSHLVPSDYLRKQTLVNGERYINESLKEMEERVLKAEEKRVKLELELFERVRDSIAKETDRIRDTALAVAAIDVIGAFARAADIYNYSRPEVHDSDTISITDGRHPVVEQTVRGEDFVPNDIHLDSSRQQVLIITGPNMAGKSTILRQTALTVIMAQMGCFVPASQASIGIADRIFTRVGASDDLARGRSTFMVEMSETANILRNATSKSLVILDEIGRGTSTYDGLSIAWAVAETLHDRYGNGVRTLFATHYHELTEMVSTRTRVRNFNVAVREWNDQIIFLRKMVPGATSRSYGLQCARIAGIPEAVVRRAREILESLEGPAALEGRIKEVSKIRPSRSKQPHSAQLSLFRTRDDELRSRILSLDIGNMTPLEALVELNKLKEYAQS